MGSQVQTHQIVGFSTFAMSIRYNSWSITQHIRQRLAAVIYDLKNTIKQKVAKAYLTRIFIVESLKFEFKAKFYDDDLRIKYINEDYMTNASDSFYLALFFPLRKYWRIVFTDNELADRN